MYIGKNVQKIIVQSDTVGRNIRKIRKEHKMTQAELAELLGCTQPYISALEKGSGIHELDSLKKVAKVLHVSVNYLLQ